MAKNTVLPTPVMKKPKMSESGKAKKDEMQKPKVKVALSKPKSR